MKVFVTGGSGYVGRNLIRRLVAEGASVFALARSDASAAIVEEAGASAARGDLGDSSAMQVGADACDVFIHCAAKVDEWGPAEDFDRINVQGTKHALDAAIAAGVARFVHVSTEAVLAGGPPLVRVDESAPLPERPAGEYARTKGLAEGVVQDATGIDTVIVRPRFVWGGDDTTLIPAFAEAKRDGRFAWIAGGTALTSTCHVDNLVQALWLAATHANARGCYFVTDGEPIAFREFLTAMMATSGVSLPDKSVPLWLAKTVASVTEGTWRTFNLKGKPPITHMVIELLGREVTIDDARIRRELGFENVINRAEGLAALAAKAIVV